MKTLKHFLLVSACLFLGGVMANAQNIADEATQPAPKPFKVYCQLVSSNAFFSSKVNIDFDFGQMSNFWNTNKDLVDENGKSIKFNSMVDALNYFGARGWELVDRYYEQKAPEDVDKSEAPKHYWIMCKTVTSFEEALEGLTTSGQFKGKE